MTTPSEEFFMNSLIPNPKSQNILLVEDDEESEMLVQYALKSFDSNINLVWVKSAEEAEKILKKSDNFDLIILDHYLEGEKTGFDLWKSFRHRDQQNVVFTSSLSSKSIIK